MSRPGLSTISLVVLGLAGCGERPQGVTDLTGRLSLEAPGRGVLVREAASAWWCARDSTLSAVAVGERWSAAVAVRTGTWPLEAVAAFEVDSVLGGPGSAAIGVRPLRDTVGAAYRGFVGTVHLATDSLLGGSIEAAVVSSLGDTLRLTGSLAGIRVRTGRCPS